MLDTSALSNPDAPRLRLTVESVGDRARDSHTVAVVLERPNSRAYGSAVGPGAFPTDDVLMATACRALGYPAPLAPAKPSPTLSRLQRIAPALPMLCALADIAAICFIFGSLLAAVQLHVADTARDLDAAGRLFAIFLVLSLLNTAVARFAEAARVAASPVYRPPLWRFAAPAIYAALVAAFIAPLAPALAPSSVYVFSTFAAVFIALLVAVIRLLDRRHRAQS